MSLSCRLHCQSELAVASILCAIYIAVQSDCDMCFCQCAKQDAAGMSLT
jgi:hypothetical protein